MKYIHTHLVCLFVVNYIMNNLFVMKLVNVRVYNFRKIFTIHYCLYLRLMCTFIKFIFLLI